MSPEEIARLENPDGGEVLDQIEEEAEEIDELTEQLVAHSIMSEQRHEEILERVDQCRQTVENLSQTASAENPVMTQVLSELRDLRVELTSLKQSMDSISRNPSPNPSETQEQQVEENVEVVLPVQETERPERKKRRVL